MTDLPRHLGEGRTRLWRIEALRMTKSSPCLKEPAVAMIGNRKQTLEFVGKYLLLWRSRRRLGIMLCYLSRVAGFYTGTSVYSCIFPSIFQISSSCSIKLSCWNKYYAEIKLGLKQMGEQGLLFWKISTLANLLHVFTAIAAIQPGSIVFFQSFCSIFFLIDLSFWPLSTPGA